jgi:hypothetical protein
MRSPNAAKKRAPVAKPDTAPRQIVSRSQLLEALKENKKKEIESYVRARVALGDLFEKDIEYWYDRLKWLAENGVRDDDVKLKAVLGILHKIAPDKKQNERVDDNPNNQKGPVAIFNVHGVSRGTVEAHDDHVKHAIEIKAEKSDG